MQNFYEEAPVTEDLDFKGMDESEISAVHVQYNNNRPQSRAHVED